MAAHLVHYIDNIGIGGAQSMMFELYHAISKYYPKYKQSIWTGKKGKAVVDKSFLSTNEIKYSVVEESNIGDAMVRRFVGSKEPSVLIFHKLMSSNTREYRALLAKVPIITINHTFSASPNYNFISKCNAMVYVSNRMRKAFRGTLRTYRQVIIQNGIDHERYDSIEPVLRQSEGVLVTGRINIMNQIKYSDEWLNWAKKVKLPKPMRHEYIGSGTQFHSAEKIAASPNGPNSIVLHGLIHEFAPKIAILKSWDLFLYEINRDEGTSISVLEALACGVPVICSDHYGNKEIIEEGVNGYVFKTREDAAEILNRLCNNPEELQQLKESTKQHFIDHLDIKYRASEYVDLIERVIRDSPKTAAVASDYEEYANQREKEERKEERKDKIKEPATSKSKHRNRLRIKRAAIRKRNTNPLETTVDHPVKVERQVPQKTIDREQESRLVLDQSGDRHEQKFSILTAGRNCGIFLKDYVNSILAQRYRPLEVIYVDDCSDDKTFTEMQSYSDTFQKADIGFRLVRNTECIGCGSSYRVAAKHATGRFFGVLDSDDMLVDDAVEYIMYLYNEYTDVAWIYTQFQICNIKMKPEKLGFCKAPGRNNESLLRMGQHRKHAYSHWRTYSYRIGEPYDQVFQKNLKAAVDKYMGYRLEELAKGMFSDRICYLYRQGVNGSISKSGATRAAWSRIITDALSRRKKGRHRPHKVLKHHPTGKETKILANQAD